MPFSFLPRMIYPHLTDVRAEDLTARGISFLMLDFDNTIVPYTTSKPTLEMAAWAQSHAGIRNWAVRRVEQQEAPRRGILQTIRAGLHHACKKALFARHPCVPDALLAGTGPLRARRRSDLYGRAGCELRGGAVGSDFCDS